MLRWEVVLTTAVLLAAHLASFVSCERVCCEGVPNCFSDESPYDHLPLPDCQDRVQASFLLYTRRNPSEGVVVQPNVPLPFVYDGSKRTVFIIHGWQSSAEKDWVLRIRDGLLSKEDANVVTVDWSEGAGYLWYPQAAANIRLTGAMVGVVGNQMVNQGGAAPSRLWCIGASLGAHTCGQAGKYVKFGRVTGLDPAGPLFESYDIQTGLNPGAGQYVEALHSAGKGGLVGVNPGTLKPLGHVDFYPNGGGVQPGCDNYYAARLTTGTSGSGRPSYKAVQRLLAALYTDYSDIDGTVQMKSKLLQEAGQHMLMAEATPYLACSHNRATEYFIESLTSNDCHFFAKSRCSDSNDIPESCTSCGSEPCNELGYDSERAVNHQGVRGLMYLETASESPFCLG